MIRRHRDGRAIVENEADPLRLPLMERCRTLHGGRTVVSEPQHSDRMTTFGQLSDCSLCTFGRIKNPRPRCNAPTPAQHEPAVPVAVWWDLMRQRTPRRPHDLLFDRLREAAEQGSKLFFLHARSVTVDQPDGYAIGSYMAVKSIVTESPGPTP